MIGFVRALGFGNQKPRPGKKVEEGRGRVSSAFQTTDL